jgi:hypothetical protein
MALHARIQALERHKKKWAQEMGEATAEPMEVVKKWVQEVSEATAEPMEVVDPPHDRHGEIVAEETAGYQ